MKKALPSQDVFHDASDERATDERVEMLLAAPGRLVPVEPVADGRAACPQPLAPAGVAHGHALRPRTANRDNLAAGRRGQRRLPGLLLLPRGTWSQNPCRGHAIVVARAADRAASRPAPGRPRRHAYQAVWPEGRRSRHPPQSHAGSGRSEISLRAYLGNPFAGRAASAIRPSGEKRCGSSSMAAT